MNRYAVIVAGGTGQRFGSSVPKQFLLLSGKPVLMHSIEKFSPFCKSVVVALPEDFISHWTALCHKFRFQIPHAIASGGISRSASVFNGLMQIEEDGLVAIHDAARPLVSETLIRLIFSEAQERGNAVPCIPLNDSIRKIDGIRNRAVNRSDFRLIQTPQCFILSKLKDAFLKYHPMDFTDEASLMEMAGESIHLVEGDIANFKITSPADLSLAEIFFGKKDV